MTVMVRQPYCSIHRARPAQALIEFALTLPLFLLLVFGTLDLGRLVVIQSVLTLAVQEAAREGRVRAACPTTIEEDVRRWPGLASATVMSLCSQPWTSGSQRSVVASVPFELVVQNLIPAGPSFTLSAEAAFYVE